MQGVDVGIIWYNAGIRYGCASLKQKIKRKYIKHITNVVCPVYCSPLPHGYHLLGAAASETSPTGKSTGSSHRKGE